MAEINVKDLRIKPIAAAAANQICKACHYSGKVVPNSQLHLGVFHGKKCGGVMQFGPSMDKRKSLALVRDTNWNDFFELNRMAFADWLPRNSESRAISQAMRFIRKNYPNKEWVISYADASQCGDGTIYRASGFVLTNIGKNRSMLRFPDGEVYASLPITNGGSSKTGNALRRRLCQQYGVPYYTAASVKPFLDIGAEWIPGFQLRYMFFLNPKARERLTVPILPFSDIDKAGARMYKGVSRAGSAESGTSCNQQEGEGASPISALEAGSVNGQPISD